MPAVLRAGMTVEGKRAIRNPQTVSGYPQWNTYAGLGITSTAKAINMGKAKSGLPGGKSRVHRKRPLDKRNLCHRLRGNHTLKDDRNRHAFERCKCLGFIIDRCNDERKLDTVLDEYISNLEILVEQHATHHLNDLVRREQARGCYLAVRHLKR